MKIQFIAFLTPLIFSIQILAQTDIISNKRFSIGTYGRAGIAYGIGIQGQYPRSLNLNGWGLLEAVLKRMIISS